MIPSSATTAPLNTWVSVEALAQDHGSSFFVFDAERFEQNLNDLRQSFLDHYPRVELGYSYKTNYTPYLCRLVHRLGGFAEVVSEMEYELARRLEVPHTQIIFNGPYKGQAAFVKAALGGATINLDSLRDIRLLQQASSSLPSGGEIAVALRCNFALSEGRTSRFGMDVDGAELQQTLQVINRTTGLRLKGLHCHFPDRDLDSFRRRAEGMVALVNRLFPESLPDSLNIGGGYFSHMPGTLQRSFDVPPASFADYGACVGKVLREGLSGRGPLPQLFLEPGTAVVADTFQFYTRVISTKTIRGSRFATVAGSIFDISPIARSRNLPVTVLHQDTPQNSDETDWTVAGYTCIEKDILSDKVLGPITEGDFLRYDNVGSYSIVMKPPFILPANPILAAERTGFKIIKARETTDNVFNSFTF